MGNVNSSSSESDVSGPDSPNKYHFVTATAAHIKVTRIDQAWSGNRLDIAYQIILGAPGGNGELIFQSDFEHPIHHPILPDLNDDVYTYVLMHFLQHGNCLVSAVGPLGEFPTCIRIYIFRPHFNLSAAEKRGLIPIRCFHGSG